MKLLLSIIVLFSLALAADSYAWTYLSHGHLNSSGEVDQHPNNGLYYATKSEKVVSFLIGKADIDLYLYTYSDGQWTEVAVANSDQWAETLTYSLKKESWYAWFVVLKSPNTVGSDYSVMITKNADM